jgi:predicted nucleic acid-binding protein
MPLILIDTNLLLYLYDTANPEKQIRAELVLEELKKQKIGRLSVQALSEFLSSSIRKLSPKMTPAESLRQVELFARTWPVFNLTPLIVIEAGRGLRDHQLSFYDAQIWASARLNQVPVVFSEDFRDGTVLEGVRFVNPFASEFELGRWTN